jgi:PAS domain S-box-containing protein
LYTYSVVVDPAIYEIIKPLGFAYMAICLLVGVVGLVWPFLTRAPKEHRRLWPVALCAAVATFLFVGSSLLPYMIFKRYVINPEISILSFGLLPIGFVWSMFSYRVLGVGLGPWALLRTVFDSVTDPIFVVNRDGRLVNSSRSGLKMLGIERLGQAKEPFVELLRSMQSVGESASAISASLLIRVLAGEVVSDEEEQLSLRDGSVVHMSVTGTPILSEQGNVELVVLNYRNITLRKQTEEALRKAQIELEIRVRERTAELARAVDELREAATRLEEGQKTLQELNGRILLAEEEERRRLAADLHDEPLQRIMLLMRHVDSCPGLRSRENGVCRDLIREAATTLRRVCADFHPPLLEDLGLGPSLEWLAESVSRSSGMTVRFTAEDDVVGFDIPRDMEVALFRVAQEALNNAVRHSDASAVEIHLSSHVHSLVLSVKDDGKGFALTESPSQLSMDGHMGLIGMRERMRMIGGQLEISTAPGVGTEIIAVAQMPSEALLATEVD